MQKVCLTTDLYFEGFKINLFPDFSRGTLLSNPYILSYKPATFLVGGASCYSSTSAIKIFQ